MSTAHALGPARTPGRPGPGPLPAALLRKVNLVVRRRIDGMLAGDHRSWALGDGAELAQVRPYVAGDDVRLIDWNVTARTGEPHIRVNVAERAVETWLLLDTSASMTFGTADRRKWDVAEGVSLAIGNFAVAPWQPPRGRHLRRPEPLHLAGPAGHSRPPGPSPRPAARARSRAHRADVTRYRAQPPRPARPSPRRDRRRLRLPRPARLAPAAAPARVAPRRGRDRDPRPARAGAAGRRRPLARRPRIGQQLRVDTRSRKLRERFGADAAAEREELARELRSLGVAHLTLSTSGDWLRRLVGFLQTEGRRR